MKRLAILLALLASAPAQAATLVNETHRPLTGYLTTWASHMRAYSVAGPVVVHPDASWCSWNTPACAGDHEIWWAFARFPRRQTTQHTLYHELGHVFDFAYMTNADHARLAPRLNRDIGARLTAWFTGDTHEQESQDSLGEYFADQYANCAQHDTVNEDPVVCRYINRVGRERGAVPPWTP